METSEAKVNSGHDLAASDKTKALSAGKQLGPCHHGKEDGDMPQTAAAQTLFRETFIFIAQLRNDVIIIFVLQAGKLRHTA